MWVFPFILSWLGNLTVVVLALWGLPQLGVSTIWALMIGAVVGGIFSYAMGLAERQRRKFEAGDSYERRKR